MTTECLYTTVRNVSGEERAFGFLPPHGRRLADDEQISIPGHLADYVAGKNRRSLQALEACVEAGDLIIMRTPAVHLYDPTLDVIKVLDLEDGDLGVVDPCWGSYSSSA